MFSAALLPPVALLAGGIIRAAPAVEITDADTGMIQPRRMATSAVRTPPPILRGRLVRDRIHSTGAASEPRFYARRSARPVAGPPFVGTARRGPGWFHTGDELTAVDSLRLRRIARSGDLNLPPPFAGRVIRALPHGAIQISGLEVFVYRRVWGKSPPPPVFAGKIRRRPLPNTGIEPKLTQRRILKSHPLPAETGSLKRSRGWFHTGQVPETSQAIQPVHKRKAGADVPNPPPFSGHAARGKGWTHTGSDPPGPVDSLRIRRHVRRGQHPLPWPGTLRHARLPGTGESSDVAARRFARPVLPPPFAGRFWRHAPGKFPTPPTGETATLPKTVSAGAPFIGGVEITAAAWLSVHSLSVQFTTCYTGLHYQLYSGRCLIGVTDGTTETQIVGTLKPSAWPEPLQVVAVTVPNRLTDYGPELPDTRAYNRIKLRFAASGWPSDSEFIDIHAGTSAGAGVDENHRLARLLFTANDFYTFITEPLAGSGTWNLRISGVDKIGNRGTPLAASETVVATPPDVPFDGSGNRFTIEIANGNLSVSFSEPT